MPHNPESRDFAGSEAELHQRLVEYDDLDGEFQRLEKVWSVAKRLLTRPDERRKLDYSRIEQELAEIHERQHAILNRQAEIETYLLAVTRNRP